MGAVAPDAGSFLRLTDDALLAQCAVDTYRASGPGGQKRNKTSSAVRLRHQPTGLVVTAVESRSQHENRARALKRLRQAIALNQRTAWSDSDPAPDFYAVVLQESPGLHVSPRHPEFFRIMQHVLDVLAGCACGTADAARALGISTGQLIRFLKSDEKLWQQANRMREAAGRSPLH